MDGNYTFNVHFLTASITSHLTSSYPPTYNLTFSTVWYEMFVYNNGRI